MKKYKAKFYGIPCYFEPEENKLYGRIKIFDYAISLMTFIHCGFSFVSEIFTGEGLDFPILIEGGQDDL